eukprot:TRINITY_DN83447_c0_g1_i1.p1 TRINITY_DN83447_c0_g1~~TRINITY_DN83447_c0_g1_i1.p1  ORF type:complete len:146 (-),score=36.96 TRINITY_DN83447_c0_g1_i1:129-566(-)
MNPATMCRSLSRCQRMVVSCPGRFQARTISQVATVEEFKELSPAKEGAPVLAFFTASWCQPCRDVVPHLEDLSSRLEGKYLKMARVDVAQLPEVAREHGVEAVPYFLVLRDGHVVERLAGNGPKAIEEVAERHAAMFEELQKKKE